VQDLAAGAHDDLSMRHAPLIPSLARASGSDMQASDDLYASGSDVHILGFREPRSGVAGLEAIISKPVQRGFHVHDR